jgi:hypothetical protein
MFAGHVGVGLAIGRVERRVNVGVFVASALLLDFVLWLFVLGGLESMSVRRGLEAQPAWARAIVTK